MFEGLNDPEVYGWILPVVAIVAFFLVLAALAMFVKWIISALFGMVMPFLFMFVIVGFAVWGLDRVFQN